ncbi:CapA family protein [Paenibacillus sp. P26]|nr:CapA family protein [Paenibacillus sp. P26]
MWVKIGVLTAITIGSFAYLIQSLDHPPAGAAGGETGAEASGGTAVLSKPPRPISAEVPDKDAAAGVKVAGSPADAAQGRVNLSFVGDVMFADKVEGSLKQNGYDYPYKYVKSYLEKADIAVANLETPITTRGTAQDKEYTYRSAPAALPELKKAGVDLVNLANNHSMDYGPEGSLDTMDYLDVQGIPRVGAGHNSDEAYKYVLLERGGMKIAFLGFTRVVPETSWYAGKSKPGLAETYSTKQALDAIAKARADADLVVVIAHWGEERKDIPNNVQTTLAHQYIDQGADLVVASHPHVLQGFEQYKGKWIAYSLGNFIFTTNDVQKTWESMILQASCTKDKACDLSVVPILTKGAQPVRMPDEDATKLFSRLAGISYNAAIDEQGKVTVGPVRPFTPEIVQTEPPASEKKPVSGQSPSSGAAAGAQQGSKSTANKNSSTKSGIENKESSSKESAGKESTNKDTSTKDKNGSDSTDKSKSTGTGSGSSKASSDSTKKKDTTGGTKTSEKSTGEKSAEPSKKASDNP